MKLIIGKIPSLYLSTHPFLFYTYTFLFLFFFPPRATTVLRRYHPLLSLPQAVSNALST
jgi:hypothetical protein